MDHPGENELPGKSDLRSGADDGDFDLSGFADGDAAPASPKPAKPPKPAGERKTPQGPAKGPGAPRSYDKGAPRGPRSFEKSFEKGPRPGYGAREGGPRAGGPRYGGPREGGPKGGAGFGGPREGGPREGGTRPPFKKDYGDRGERGDRGDRPFRPRGEGGDRPFRPRGEGGDRPYGPRHGGPGPGAPRRFGAPKPFVPGAEAAPAKPVSPEVRPWLPLKQDKGRWKESRFLLEGAKNIADALEVSPAIFHMAFVADDFKEKPLLAALKKHRIETVPVSADDIRALSETEAPQGIIAVCNFATLRPDWNSARYVTVLDAVQDPGNVGAIFRTSAALGMDAMVLGKGSCDPYNPKVVRSSVGALLGMPFETGEELGSKINFLRQKGFSVVATSSHAKETLGQAKLRKKVALIVGNEGAGTGASYLDMADAVVKIPLKSKVESLNVAVAHGILSYQLIHGRE